MRAGPPPGAKHLVWCLSHYFWVVVVSVLALTAVPLLVDPGPPLYEARALVVARELTVRPQVLPQMGEAIFANGAVAARVATDPSVTGTGAGLIPDRLSVVAAQDSIVLIVQARDPDAVTAARLANLAVEAFVEELNRPGAGVGEFGFQAPATVPAEPLRRLGPEVRAGVGALAGLLLGLGIIALLTIARRPVVTTEDVRAATGVPLLGTVKLPGVSSRTATDPLSTATVTRWFGTLPSGRLLMVSPPSAAWLRDRLYVVVAVALSTLRPVRFEAPTVVIDTVRKLCAAHREAGRTVHLGAGGEHGVLILVDGGSPLELLDPATSNVFVVGVAPLGISRRRLRALTSDYLDCGLVGVVLVDVRPGPHLARRSLGQERAAAPTGARIPGTVPQVEGA